MADQVPRPDDGFDLESAAVNLAFALDAASQLVGGCRDLPEPEGLGSLLGILAAQAGRIRDGVERR